MFVEKGWANRARVKERDCGVGKQKNGEHRWHRLVLGSGTREQYRIEREERELMG